MYKVLEDDQNFWPPYNLVPIVRQDVLEANPDIETIINNINATLDTQTVVDLNASVDIDGRDYMEVAEEYYNSIQ